MKFVVVVVVVSLRLLSRANKQHRDTKLIERSASDLIAYLSHSALRHAYDNDDGVGGAVQVHLSS